MSAEDIRKKVDQERRFAQEQEDRKLKEYFSLPTVKEWDGVLVKFSNRMYSELFPGISIAPPFIRGSSEIINRRFQYVWRVVEKNYIAFYYLVDVGLIRWNEKAERNPASWRGELHTGCIQSTYTIESSTRGLGKSFSSPSELEAAFDDIFEYFYRRKSNQE